MEFLFEHGREKFPKAAVLASSASLGWAGVATEVRSHPACSIPPFTSVETEITIALRGRMGAYVKRSAGGIRQQTAVGTGTLWITPAGSHEEATRITEDLSDIAHIYLSHELVSSLNAESSLTGGWSSINYAADVRDELIKHMGLALITEMREPTPGGKVLAESLSLALAARLFQRHSTRTTCSAGEEAQAPRHLIDDLRIRRVVDYMMAHLEEPIGLNELAAVACLSTFHFARTFRMKAGLPPHQFLARLRLEHARKLLARSNRTISDIAFACQFSSQSNFSRAFKKFAGSTPNEFRRLG